MKGHLTRASKRRTRMEMPSIGNEQRLGYALALFLGLLLVTGCAPQSRPPVRAAKPGMSDGYVLLTLTPAMPRALDAVVFTVHVTGKDNRPVAGAKVTADLSMPGMEMPPNTVFLTPTTPGTYTGQGRFSMPDQWAVAVTIVDKARRTSAAFPITVR